MALTAIEHASTIAVIGVGPRGLATLERLVENARAHDERKVAIVAYDDAFPGAGSVWRPDQPGELLMNTVAGQVTMFTDKSVPCEGPIVPGPSLYEWSNSPMSREWITRHYPNVDSVCLRPDDYPTRAYYGCYLTWVLEDIKESLPKNVKLTVKEERVEDLLQEGDRWNVRSKSGDQRVDQVVITAGHLPGRLDGSVKYFADYSAKNNLTYIPPGNPADADLTSIRPGQEILIRGLGLCFFDYLPLLTVARGGEFDRGDDGVLIYRASGQEPKIIAGCRRGVPHHARGVNQKGIAERHEPRFLTESMIEHLSNRRRVEGGLDFMEDIWPLVRSEVEYAYYRLHLPTLEEFQLKEIARSEGEDKIALLKESQLPRREWFDWRRIIDPSRTDTSLTLGERQDWLMRYLEEDLESARRGNARDPLKCAVDVLRDMRNEVRQVVDHGMLKPSSYRDHVAGWYTPLNAFLSIGPPEGRIEELLALMKAGIITVQGEGMCVDASSAGIFAVYSPHLSGSRREASCLIEARLPNSNIVNTSDSLIQKLTTRGVCGQHSLKDDFNSYFTGSMDITESPYKLIARDGSVHSNVYAFGVPTEGVHWATAAGVRPGVGSVILSDADSVARAALGLS